MKNLFESAALEEVKERMTRLQPDRQPLWGKMYAAQAMAHCSEAMKMARGNITPPRVFIGRLVGPLAKKVMIVNGRPMPRNVAADKSLIVSDARDFVAERQRLRESVDRFAADGAAGCTKHPHFFSAR
jgi:hypothetical protein